MLNKKKLKILIITVLLGFTGMRANAKHLVCSNNNDTTVNTSQQENELIRKFQLACKQFNGEIKNYTLGGIMNVSDKHNPGDDMKNIPFLFCKRGSEFYYKVGPSVTLNEQGVYLYIDQQAKTIIVSKQKQVKYDAAGFKQFSNIAAKIKDENYSISGKTTGVLQTVSLINERHISCKQYSLTFNKATYKIARLYMRFTNINYPDGIANDKVVDISVSKWDKTADLTAYLSKGKIIKNVNGSWKPTDQFKQYKIITM